MKKIYLIGLTALTLGFASCDEIDDPMGKPASNPQEEIVAAGNVTTEQLTTAVALDALNDAGKMVEVAKVSKGEDWPEGFEAVVPSIEIAKSADFAEAQTVEAELNEDGVVVVSPDAWEAAHRAIYGKNPAQTQSYVRMPVWAVNDTQKVRMGGIDVYYGNYAVDVTPFDLYEGRVIEEKYYLLTSADNFSVAGAVELLHTGDADVYANPEFSTPVIMVDNGGLDWIIIPGSAKASGNLTAQYASFGVGSDATALSGALVANTTGSRATAGKLAVAGPKRLTVNMDELTYTVTNAYEQIYVPGGGNGWSFVQPVLTTTDYTVYSGYEYLTGSFKFSGAAGWVDTCNWGLDPDDPKEGHLISSGSSKDIAVAEAGLYFVSMNVDELTYTLTPVTSISVLGDWNGWNVADNNAVMTPSADYLTWTLTATMKTGQPWKFNMNKDGDWALNLGGALDNLTQGGANMTAPEDGTYLITLDLSAVPYKATMVKQ